MKSPLYARKLETKNTIVYLFCFLFKKRALQGQIKFDKTQKKPTPDFQDEAIKTANEMFLKEKFTREKFFPKDYNPSELKKKLKENKFKRITIAKFKLP